MKILQNVNQSKPHHRFGEAGCRSRRESYKEIAGIPRNLHVALFGNLMNDNHNVIDKHIDCDGKQYHAEKFSEDENEVLA